MHIPARSGPAPCTAVVLGGSIAGLLAARVLVEFCDHVTLLERDRGSLDSGMRPGVPQAQHVHALLIKGQHILETLFPGLRQELLQAGGHQLDWMQDWRLLSLWGWLEQHESDLMGVCCSRPLLEATLRQRLLAYENFHLRSGCTAQGLRIQSHNPRAIAGVEFSQRSDAGAPAAREWMPATLVVDATGRHSKLPQWLKTLGYPAPRQTRVNSFLGYASRWYRSHRPPQDSAVILTAKPGVSKRGGVVYPIEHQRILVTLSGIGGDHPPAEEAGFLAFAHSLRAPDIYEIIQDSDPLTPITCYRRTENQWRHYEDLRSFPGGLVTLGDSVCCFNPVYGQGMTAAALGAMVLSRAMQALPSPQDVQHPSFSRRFQRQLASVLQAPWLMATGEDFRWPETQGRRPGKPVQILQAYFDRAFESSTWDPQMHEAFIEVVHLARSPWALLTPALLWKSLGPRRKAGPPCNRSECDKI
ncbi:FAD-dependent oxidoreductase [Lyngbya confervoides]|uniref:2-polyprenyl-6-methoxyphenol hydroxylase-like oxidoreductase n=1 Tax=Lyngbya confervoides BDU141951 TaxID=1574623 RepID=A0ABD4T1T7_9CYAN|nr:2-polyprenyl-6-methoxyphenol hydroxylase-like oxidoreductase [Lyngbya confervoides]MCM1982552.1 2-polyprenyl-6-methoxyphenol hydroxylase-like oxidoreductase [Lyngbya confervoides BDU141951]